VLCQCVLPLFPAWYLNLPANGLYSRRKIGDTITLAVHVPVDSQLASC
jgi:hypothetical protein